MKTIPRFLAGRFIGGFLLALSAVSAVIFATSFMQSVASAPTVMAAADEALMHFLEMLPMFLPLVVFIATLMTFYKLLMSSELVIIQGAGLSAFKIMRPMLWTSALAGLLWMLAGNPAATAYSSRDLAESKIERIDNAVWLREKTDSGSLIIRAADMKYDGGRGLIFRRAAIIRQNNGHQITGRIDAETLTLADGILSAKNALILGSKGAARRGDFAEPTGLMPDGIIRQYLKPNQVSFWELPEFIGGLRKTGAPTNMHELQFLSLLFLPVMLISMTALGVLFSQTKRRRTFSFAKHFGFGIITCFAVYFAIQIFNAMGESGGMAPVLAVWFPPAIVLFFAGALIARSDKM
jgi:lipopolysaccharide export system permease protein